MSTETVPRPVGPDVEDDWTHAFCPCTPDFAICGADVSDTEEALFDGLSGDECPLCLVLAAASGCCSRCGQ